MFRTGVSIACALALALAACGPAGSPAPAPESVADDDAKREEARLSVTGSLSYRERIMLPADGYAVVELRERGADAPLLASTRFDLDGRAPPYPFAITLDAPPSVRLALRAEIHAGGALRFTGGIDLPDEAIGAVDAGLVLLAAAPSGSKTTELTCGEAAVDIVSTGEGLRASIDGATHEMRPVESASGARYAAADDAALSLWNKGDAWSLVRGDATAACVARAASPADAPTLSAKGNEPFWLLTMADGAMQFRPQPDGETVAAQLESAEPFPGGVAYRGGGLLVRVRDAVCRDTMSGLPYPATVTVDWDGNAFAGCGGAPENLFVGIEWIIEDVNGGGIVDGSRATLTFGSDGRVGGLGSCNAYTAAWTLTGEGLTIGPAAATRKACAPALMAQEDAVFAILAEITLFDIGPDGALVLSTADGRTLTARKAG